MMRYVIAACALVTLGACGFSSEAPGGETHFMEPCETDETCGEGMACVCGTCTLGCFSDAGCGEIGEDTVCVTAQLPKLYGECVIDSFRAPGVCLAACEQDAECHVWGLPYGVDGGCAPALPEAVEVVPTGEWGPTAGPVGTGAAPVFVSDQGQLFLGSPAHLLRSTNGGRNWDEVAKGQAMDVAAVDGALVALFTDAGVYRSVDGGASWRSAAGVGAPGEIFSVQAGAGRFFAVAGGKDVGDRSAIVVSDDAGSSWTALAPLPDNEAVGEIFAAEDVLLATGLYSGKLHRSTDGGVSWAIVEEGRAGWATSFAAHGTDLFAMAPGAASVFRSTDRGLSWSEVVLSAFDHTGFGLPALVGAGDELFAALGSGSVFRWDPALARWVDAGTGLPGGRITALAGGAAGIWLGADDLLFRWSAGSRKWEAIDLTLVETRVVALAEEAGTLLASSGSDAVHRSFDGGATWSRSSKGLPTNAQVNQLALHGNTAFAATAQHGLFTSFDGESWLPASSGLPQLPGGAGTPVQVSAFAFSGDSAWIGTTDAMVGGTVGSGVLRSTDGGASWAPARAGLPQIDEASYEAILALRASGDVLYAATSGGGLFASSDGGESWKAAAAGLPAGAQVRALAETTEGVVAAVAVEEGASTALYRSTDEGQSWALIGDEAVFAGSVQALASRDNLLAASVVGGEGEKSPLLVSSDGGATWKVGGSEAAVLPGPLAAGHEAIFVGTGQAGVWKLGLQEIAAEQ